MDLSYVLENPNCMLPKFSLIFICASFMIFAQQDPILFDGQLAEDEWNQAQRFSIDYEIQPGNNSPAPHKTDIFSSTLPRISMLVLTL